MSREKPEENLVRFPAMLQPAQLEEIDSYRRDIGTLPSKGKAIRDLINLGLAAYWKEKEGRED